MSDFGSGLNVDVKLYENTANIKGNPSARAVLQCPWDERWDVRNAILGTVDPYDDKLVISEVLVRSLGDPQACVMAELTCGMISLYSATRNDVDAPFQISYEGSSTAITIAGGYHWDDDDDSPVLNRGILPVKTFKITKVVLSGLRSSVNAATYNSYLDKVNSDTFLGESAEKILFRTWSGTPQQHPMNSSIVYSVQLELLAREKSWNEFFREETGKFVKLLQDGTNAPVYASTPFAGLLT